MTLDPVHFDGIAELADRIEYEGEERNHRELAREVWENYLDPLYHDGTEVLAPLTDLERRCANIEELALETDQFETMHGLDSGSINPKVFKNGLVVDVAHAAMSSSPSDLDLHDSRTVVKALHTNDVEPKFGTEWESYNEGSKRRIVHAPRRDEFEQDIVHALALYRAESRHALDHTEDVSDLLLLDGPVYPKGIIRWRDRGSILPDLFEESKEVRTILENYVELVETFADRDVPLAGFVKNISARSIIRTLREKGVNTPWAHDAAFFSQVLERGEVTDGEYERLTDDLTLTNWFVSRAGSDAFFGGDEATRYIDRKFAPEQYDVTFCVIYDPRQDLLFKIEAPRVFTSDETCRRRIERQVLKEIAISRGPPTVISKADSLARIGRNSTYSLLRSFERSFDSELDENYNNVRWGLNY
ncbi:MULTISPECIES: DNA double-strand break repair nuclease NurA [unclassified Haladaptatus]|uniref:DNA double-strand break repair nuclease NurA n=1 Tax=unclassified Haladaptatus TaxID=2622732 RepID=UPI00209C21A6|nr:MULTISPECIES: DNA double-strand break repair nuclease NurA [unclassified Haladaptatus]MCO8243034.1 DNA double-strand break repair nuclease NurA [Haladaptatus sp. AB643]MCO8252748.1 DNA double-strand break repair nuclease NurA [Haladaptatus sp. AB618]